MTKLVIFDLDGTLLNTLPTIAYYGNYALKLYGLPTIETERYKALIGDGRDLLIHRMLAESGNDTSELYQAVGAAYDRAYEAGQMYLTEPYEGIKEMLVELKKSGVRLAVLSNKPHNVTSVIVERVFPDVFDEVWGKKQEYPVKPSPDAPLEICRLIGAEPRDTAFVGDTAVDIKTGKNAGFLTIGVEWGFRDREELEGAGADFIVKHASEIIKEIK